MTIQGQLDTVASAAFLQSVLDAISATIAILDADGVIMAVNASWRRFADENGLAWTDYGVGRNYLATMDAARGEQSDDAHGVARGIRDVIAGRRERFSVEYPCDSPDKVRWYTMWVTPLALPGHRGAVIAHQDITLRKLSEMAAESARAAEAQQRRIAEKRRAVAAGLGDIVGILNSDRPLPDVLDYILDRALELLGARMIALLDHARDEPLVVRITGATPAPLSSARVSALRALLLREAARHEVSVLDSAMLDDMAQPDVGTLLMAPIVMQDERYGALVVQYARPRTMLQEEVDLVQDVASQISLAVGNARLRERVESHAAAAERGRMLRELHDSVSQALFSANLIADALPRLWKSHPQQAEQGLTDLRGLIRTAHLDIRSMLLDLAPSAVTDEPLGVLLRRLAEAVSARSGVPIKARVDRELSLPVAAKIALYRIAEEALNNAAKHAHATEIELVFERVGEEAQLSVADDGAGFSPGEIAKGRWGLRIMQDRSESIGARFELLTAPGEGCRIEVHWPLAEGG